MDETLFLARFKEDGSHAIIRLVRNGVLSEGLETPDIDSVNRLLLCRRASELLACADSLGPLTVGPDVRLVSMLEAERSARELFLPSSAGALLNELYFDPYCSCDGEGFVRVGRGSTSDAYVTAAAFDLLSSLSSVGDGLDKGAWSLSIEPIASWLFTRNVLSLVLRIASVASAGSSEPLSDAGFKLDRANGRYEIPLLATRGGRVMMGEAVERGFALLPSPDGLWWMLTLECGREESQASCADLLIRFLDAELFDSRVSLGGPKGDELRPYRRAETLLGAIWPLVRHHPGRYLMTCDNCHRTVLSGTQGGERRFCSTSCRATWNKAHREGK